jgi:hypothetical protein
LLRPLTNLDPEALPMWEAGKTDLFGLLDSGWVVEGIPGGAD